METKRITIICIILAAILLIITGFNFISQRLNNDRPVIIRNPEPYIPEIDFVPNEVILMFKEDADDEEIKGVFDRIPDLNSYEVIHNRSYLIKLNHDFNSRYEINSFCNSLENEKEFLESCEANNIYKLDDCSKGPC